MCILSEPIAFVIGVGSGVQVAPQMSHGSQMSSLCVPTRHNAAFIKLMQIEYGDDTSVLHLSLECVLLKVDYDTTSKYNKLLIH